MTKTYAQQIPENWREECECALCDAVPAQPASGAVDERELPPLPKPDVACGEYAGPAGEGASENYYTADQMREYARAALSASNQVNAAQPVVAQPALAAIPEELRKIGELLRTQDNRITDQPIFIVQQKRTYVTEDGYNDCRHEWRETESGEYIAATSERAKRLEAVYAKTLREPNGWKRYAEFDVWEFVTACFTEQGCKNYIAINGHNLKEPRIYAGGSFRNHEYRFVRDWLMSLSAIPPAQPDSKDAELLNFIEQQGNAFTWGIREHTEPVGSYVVNIGDGFSVDGPTFRDAIDAAIAASKAKGNGE